MAFIQSMTGKGLKELLDTLENLSEATSEKSVEVIKDFTFESKKKVSDRIRDGRNGSLKSRTGELRRSIRTSNRGKHLKSMRASIYSVSKYAPIHETGGTIKAKNKFKHLAGGPFLAIPSSDNRTPSGVMKETPREVFNGGGYTVPLSGGKAKHAMFKGGKPMFWLVKEVKIKARLEMQKTIEDGVPTLLSNLSALINKSFFK